MDDEFTTTMERRWKVFNVSIERRWSSRNSRDGLAQGYFTGLEEVVVQRESSRRLQLERRKRERENVLLRRANYKTASITERDSVPRFSRADRDVPVRMGKEECGWYEGLDRRVVDREPEHRSNHRGAQ